VLSVCNRIAAEDTY